MRLRASRNFVVRTPQKTHSITKGKVFEIDDKTAETLLKANYAVECTEEQNASEPEQEMNPDTEITAPGQETSEPEQDTPEPAKKKKSKAKKAEVKPDETESGFAK